MLPPAKVPRVRDDDPTTIAAFYESARKFALLDDLDEVAALCRAHCQLLGFEYFVYALRAPTEFADAELRLINGYPEGWVDRYFERSYHLCDPVIAYCSRRVAPIQWLDLAPHDDPQAAAMMADAARFGLRAGASVAMHSPNGELGVLSVALDRDPTEAHSITQRALPYLQVWAGHLHEAARRVFGLADADDDSRLTKRERECLRWAADGKTSWEIARLLRLSERTVNFHLNNSVTKLKVCNRQHAVAKAVWRGLIHPSPF